MNRMIARGARCVVFLFTALAVVAAAQTSSQRTGEVLWLGEPRQATNTAIANAGDLLFL